MKRSSSLQYLQSNNIIKNNSKEFTRRSVTLPRETMERFEDVCTQLNLETNDLLKITIELFLSSKIWDELECMKNEESSDC